MAANLDTPRGGREPAKETGDTASDAAKAPEAKASGGFKAWLPLVVTVVTMPALAYATTVFVLVPKMQRTLTQTASGSTQAAAPSAAGAPAGEEGGKTGAAQKTKVMVPLTKLLVN